MEKKTVSMTVRLEEDIAAKILKMAESDERSVSYVIRKLLMEALARGQKK